MTQVMLRIRRGVLAVSVALTPALAQGQQRGGSVISGRVTDAQTGAPVTAASVIFNDVSEVIVGNDGRFQIVGVAFGTHVIQVRRLGYTPMTLEVQTTADDPRLSVSFVLTPIPAELEPLSIMGRSGLAGFYERREGGFGHFLTREEFGPWNPTETTDVLRRLPGVRVRNNPLYTWDSGTGVPDRRRYIVETSRGGQTTYNTLGGPECPVSYWLDGVRLGNDRDNPIDELLSVNQIEAMESYVGVQVPPQFYHPEARCGVIAFWTRMGRDATGTGRSRTMIGAVVGAGLGVTLGLVSPASCGCLVRTERVKRSLANGVVLGLIGALAWQMFPGADGHRPLAHSLRIEPIAGPRDAIGVALIFLF